MSSDKDMRVGGDADIVFTDGLHGSDVEIVEGASLVAQDVTRMIRMVRGGVPWDNNAGSQILERVNTPMDSAFIESELFRIVRADARIDQESFFIETKENKTVLKFRVLGESREQEVMV